MGKIRINKGHAIPLIVRICILVAFCFVFYIVANKLPVPIAIPILLLISTLGPASWFCLKILTVDTKNRTIHDGIWIMNKKVGGDLSFETIESVYAEKANKPTSYGPLPVYNAYLKLDNGSVHTLLVNKSKKEVDDGILLIKKKLGIK